MPFVFSSQAMLQGVQIEQCKNGVRNASWRASNIFKCVHVYPLEAISSPGYELGLFFLFGQF